MSTLIQRARDFSSPSLQSFHLILASLIGILLGLAVLLLPWPVALGVVMAPLVVLALVKRPEIGILGILLATSTIWGENQIPTVPGLYSTDIVLFALFGLIVIRLLAEPDFKLIHSPLSLPLLAFYTVTLTSTGIALYQGTVARDAAVTELRHVTYYLIFFAVINLVRTQQQLVVLLRGITVLAVFVAIVTLIQYLLGQSAQLVTGRIEVLTTEGATRSDITRITNFSGEAILLLAFITGAVKLTVERFRGAQILRLFLWVLFGVGVILTFNRNFWIASGLVFAMLGLLINRHERQRYFAGAMALAFGVIMIMAIAYSQPDSRLAGLVEATMERVGSLADTETFEANPTSTLRWRDFEYQYALPQIPSNLFIGLGLGAKYRPMIPGIDYVGFNGQGYIHNAHLWLMLKSGFTGYLCFLWLSGLFLWRGFSSWRRLVIPWQRATVLGFAFTHVAVLLGSIVNPMLMQWYWIPLIGLMLAVNELLIQGALPEEQETKQRPARRAPVTVTAPNSPLTGAPRG
jgi:hypothetical protein